MAAPSTPDGANKAYKLIGLPTAKNLKLWAHFGFKSADGKTVAAADMKQVFCKIEGCPKPQIPYVGNTTNLTDHLRRHPKENAAYLGSASPLSCPSSPGSSTASSCTPSKQGTMTGFLNKPVTQLDPDSQQARLLHSKIVNFIVKDFKPLSICEGEGFIEMMQAFAPQYKVMSRRFYTRLVADKFALTVTRLQDVIERGMPISYVKKLAV